jgi:predicted DNA-binding transcriptional regulator AlpA
VFEALLEEVNRLYPAKGLLTLDEVCNFLECERQVVYNWSKRSEPKKRPPRILVGREVRFPKKDFVKWLALEQGGGSRAI